MVKAIYEGTGRYVYGSTDGSPETPTVTVQTAPRTPRAVDNNEADLQLADETINGLNDTSSTYHASPSSGETQEAGQPIGECQAL